MSGRDCSCGCGQTADATTRAAEAGRAVRTTSSSLTAANRRDHWRARWGIDRSGHRVEPGLYALGAPDAASPVFVTANYTLSFDALRSSLAGSDGYILVLDTKGINVWCAAGKGTFGTDELVGRIESVGLAEVVAHREVVVPQLGATGVAAHEVKRRSGFAVRYGPVRAEDIRRFMAEGVATDRMRTVRFDLVDRFVLIPVELAHLLVPTALAALLLYFIGGSLASWAALASVAAGAVLFPIVMPWLPTPNFSTKGFLLGLAVAVPFAVAAFTANWLAVPWVRSGWALVYLLTMPQVIAYLALNFTGSSTSPSKTGVEREIRLYFPVMVWTFGAGLLLLLVLAALRRFGGL